MLLAVSTNTSDIPAKNLLANELNIVHIQELTTFNCDTVDNIYVKNM